jgi:cytochrome c5
VAGAPKPGDKEEWAPRIAQGNDVLYKHAIEGFTGEKGMMPARGAGASLSDDEVKAAVDYMVSLSQ